MPKHPINHLGIYRYPIMPFVCNPLERFLYRRKYDKLNLAKSLIFSTIRGKRPVYELAEGHVDWKSLYERFINFSLLPSDRPFVRSRPYWKGEEFAEQYEKGIVLPKEYIFWVASQFKLRKRHYKRLKLEIQRLEGFVQSRMMSDRDLTEFLFDDS